MSGRVCEQIPVTGFTGLKLCVRRPFPEDMAYIPDHLKVL